MRDKVLALLEHAPRVALPTADGRDGGDRYQHAVRARRGTADLALLRILRSFATRRRYLRQSAYCSWGSLGVVGSSFPPGVRVRSLRDALERERVGRATVLRTRETALRCFGSHPTIPLHERSVHHHLSVIAR